MEYSPAPYVGVGAIDKRRTTVWVVFCLQADPMWCSKEYMWRDEALMLLHSHDCERDHAESE